MGGDNDQSIWAFNESNERLNDSMDGMDGTDVVVCSLMDFGI